jgi:hypothetical protein
MADIRFENEIAWDGRSLSVWAVTESGRILCKIPRGTVHALSIYNDAIEREIKRDRNDIFQILRPALVAKVAQVALDAVATNPVWLCPEDLNGRH